MASCTVVHGDLLEQPVDAIVNPWNSNVIPWFLLIPQGVSGAILKRAGAGAFRPLLLAGYLKPGSALHAPAGKLPCKGIIHVAALTPLWTTTDDIVKNCIESAVKIAIECDYKSLAIPLIGAGVGGKSPDDVIELLRSQLTDRNDSLDIRIIVYRP
ncbi:MAG: macro domain-containing protein [Armatimonadota bacterium]